jgi:hypothetical protein
VPKIFITTTTNARFIYKIIIATTTDTTTSI